jgi:hypothetical protein
VTPLDREAFRRLGYRAVDLAADYLDGIRDRPVFQPMTPDERRRLLARPPAQRCSRHTARITQRRCRFRAATNDYSVRRRCGPSRAA